MTSIKLTALPDRLGGQVTNFDREGQPIPDRGGPVFLCRCGGAADRSSCDGSHARTRWKEDA